MPHYNKDFIKLVDDFLEYKLKRKIKFNGHSIQTNLLSSSEIKLLEESTTNVIKKVAVEGSYMKFFPNQIILAEISLSQPKLPQKDNEHILISINTPGHPISETNLRVLLAADFFINSRRELGLEVRNTIYFYPYSIDIGFLLCALGSLSISGSDPLDSTESKYLEILYKQSLQSISKEEAHTAVNRLLASDILMVKRFDQILSIWKSTQETLFKKFKINLNIKCHLDLIDNNGLMEIPSKQAHLQNYYKNHKEITYHFHDRSIQPSKSQIGNIISISFSKVTGLTPDAKESKFDNSHNLENWIHNAQKLIAKESMLELDEKTNSLGLSFFKIQLLSMRKTNDVKYSASRIVNQNANIGIYIQYAYARLCGIERYIKELDWFHRENSFSLNPDSDTVFKEGEKSSLEFLALTPKVFDLIAIISNFDIVLEKSCTEPSVMVTYLFQLAKEMSSQYYHFRIKGEPKEVQSARWKVIQTCQSVLKSGIEIFGLETVDTF